MSKPRSDDDMTGAIVRLTRALGKRCAEGDPDSGVYLRMVRRELEDAEAKAVAGWRSHGFSDGDIGRELGVTKQAVQKRWPRGSTLALVAALVLALPASALAHARRAVPPINVQRAQQLDRRAEANMLGVPLSRVDAYCARGPLGNVGCTYDVLFSTPTSSASSGAGGMDVSLTLELAGWWHAHDAIVRRHGRLVVLVGTWMHTGYVR